jgi:hypothetical protein
MKLDVTALVTGLVCTAVAVVGLLSHAGRLSLAQLGVAAPVTLITVGVIGLVASRRHPHP